VVLIGIYPTPISNQDTGPRGDHLGARDVVQSVAMTEMNTRARPAFAPVSWDWAAVYEAEGPTLQRYVRRLVGPADANDLLQECFSRAMSAERRPPRREEVRPWLYRIVSNLAIDTLRRRRRWRFLSLDHARSEPAQTSPESEIVRAALVAIAPDQAVALVLRLHERLSRAEIAQALGISESAVKGRLVRGRLNFVAAYRRLGGGYR
jgi:RNA polymerase sigma-70 factor, ECF subfamily